jgi:hypothetical protein
MKTIITTLFILFSFVSFSQDSIVEYYNEIAGKSEYGDSNNAFYKWKGDVKIFFDFDNSDSLKEYTKPIIKELNELIDPINILIVDNKKDANVFIYFSSFSEYKKKCYITVNGNFLGFVCSTKYQSRIYNSYIFINENLSGIELKSVLREEITQSLGFSNDSWKYSNSIFYQGGNNENKFSELDKEIIKLHYNN